MKEIWRVIPGREAYAVSSIGRIRRERPGIGTYPGKIIRQFKGKYGHHSVVIRHNGVYVSMRVHRAVALAFIGKPPSPKHHVAHWDGDASNNVLKNLRWVLPIENEADKRRHGRVSMGSRHPPSKLTEKDVLLIRKLRAGGALKRRLAEQFKVTAANISCICNGLTWKQLPIKKMGKQYCKGADFPQSKLTDATVRAIRRKAASGSSYAALSRMYSVSEPTITRAVKRQSWKHVP